jgi:putative endonuclease
MLAHKAGIFDSFTQKYKVKTPVHFETFNTAREAISKEKHLKHWRRSWKIQLIEKSNPYWKDLSISSSLDPRKSGDDKRGQI